jgi:tetratricopeptide (TPR) repeat protein
MVKGKLDEAIVQLLKIIEKNPNYAPAYANLGVTYYGKRKLDKAIEAFKRAIEINPNHKTAHSNLGNVYTDLKRYDEAIAEHKKAIELAPSDAEAYVDLGVAFSQKGNIEEGINQFKKAISLNPYHAPARKNLAYSYYKMKKWPEAIDELLLARDIDPWYPGLEESLTITLKKAYSDLEKWVNEKPMDPLSHYYFAYALEFKSKWKKAIEEMEKAIKLDRSKGEFYKGLALFYSSANRFPVKEAITALEECVRIDPSNWACYDDLGANYVTIGKPKEALEVMMKLISRSDINPNIARIQAALGAVYARNLEYQKAIAPLEKALSLCGRNDPIIHLNLAVVYFELKKYDMAWRHVRTAERMGHPDASKLIKDLKKVSKEPE